MMSDAWFRKKISVRDIMQMVLGLMVFALAISAEAAYPLPGAITEEPFSARPFARGKTMFTEIPAGSSGLQLTNPYDDPKMRGALYLEFEGGSIGTGVAIGDYDGDGRPDIFVVTKNKGCRLFRNLGGYKFEDVTEKAGVGASPGVWNLGATFVDINNSGRLDIYVCRFNAPNLLYINQGDGTFKEMGHAYGLDVTDSSVMAAFCDYDRDGWLDVYVATNMLSTSEHPKGQRGYLFHNNHNGTFTNVTEGSGISGEAQSHAATWWDYDNDGWPDLYVANDYGGPDKLYHNNRDGTFTDVLDRVLPHTSFSSMGSDLGDVTNAGLIDLFVADMAATNHFRDQHGTAELRGRASETASSGGIPKYLRNMLFLNTGTGRFMEAGLMAGISASDWTWSVRLEDLDNDGHVDLFVTNGFNKDPSPDIYNRAIHAESLAERIRILGSSPPLENTHLAFRNLGNLEFQNVSAEWGLDKKGIAFGAALGDLNGDGNLDIVYANYGAAPTLMRNDNGSGHRANVYLRGTISNRYGIGATVKVESDLGVQMRELVLARGYMSSSEPMAHFGLGNDSIIKRMTITWPSGHIQTFENLPADMRFTVTEPSSAPPSPPKAPSGTTSRFSDVSESTGFNALEREEGVDETYQQGLIPVGFNRRGPGLAVGDVDGTGRDSAIVGGTTLDPVRILHSTSSGRFVALDLPMVAGGSLNDGPVLLFDAAGTGKQDLLVAKGGDSLLAGAPEYQPRLYLNDGQGGFRKAPDGSIPPLSINAGAMVAADFDHSGRLSVFIGGRLQTGSYPMPPTSALLANRGGRFEDVTDTLAPGLRGVGMVTSALWCDVDGDGWPDLLLTLEWGKVMYFHNNQGKGFDDWTERAGFAAGGTGWWTSIAEADFNGDGRPDFVVGNVGLNTPYRADPQHPALLFSGSFGSDDSNQLIEAYYEGDRIYPRRSRKSIAASIPSIAKRYPSNDSYARATLGEIFGEEKLAKAVRFAATELRSGVFMSQPDGTYRFEPLPRIAQISPLQGIVAGDFEGDGRPEIYAVQNSYAPIPAVGHFDGGLSQLLRTDGHGHFVPVPPRETGLIVPGDAKALAVMDIDQDGWPDFLVTRNNASSMAFHNNGVTGHGSVSVRLRGPAGNPTCVGARITVEYSDGSTQMSDVVAGSGYFSQSSAKSFFGYPDSNPPVKMRIRWPSGAESVHEVPARTPNIVFSMPGERP
jgi:hypothetical protein